MSHSTWFGTWPNFIYLLICLFSSLNKFECECVFKFTASLRSRSVILNQLVSLNGILLFCNMGTIHCCIRMYSSVNKNTFSIEVGNFSQKKKNNNKKKSFFIFFFFFSNYNFEHSSKQESFSNAIRSWKIYFVA